MRHKVVHISTVHEHYDTRIYHKECRYLQKAGLDVYLVVAGETKHKEDPIQLVSLKKRKSRLARMLLSPFEAYWKAKKLKADIYHFHDPELLLVGRLLKNKHNQVIYDVHEDYETSIHQKWYLKKPFNNIAAKAYKIMEKVLTHGMNLCLAEKYYSEKYPDGLQVLNYPILEEKKQQVKKDSLISGYNLIYTGNVTVDRGSKIHAGLPAVDPDISIHFIGKCSGAIAEDMQKIAGENQERLHFTGINQYVNREEIDEAYRNGQWLAGLALFPPTAHYMRKELTKFFEYMAAGIPIICSHFPIWDDFIKTYKCGITADPNDARDIAKAIQFLKDNPDKAREMGENGRIAVRNHLNWQHEANKLVEWYDHLLNKNVKCKAVNGNA